MTAEDLIARAMQTRHAAGLHVKLIYEGRADFDYYPRDAAQRDAYAIKARRHLGRIDPVDGAKLVDVVVY